MEKIKEPISIKPFEHQLSFIDRQTSNRNEWIVDAIYQKMANQKNIGKILSDVGIFIKEFDFTKYIITTIDKAIIKLDDENQDKINVIFDSDFIGYNMKFWYAKKYPRRSAPFCEFYLDNYEVIHELYQDYDYNYQSKDDFNEIQVCRWLKDNVNIDNLINKK